jgi:hypothetical protein
MVQALTFFLSGQRHFKNLDRRIEIVVQPVLEELKSGEIEETSEEEPEEMEDDTEEPEMMPEESKQPEVPRGGLMGGVA